MRKAVVPREEALRDIQNAIAFYLGEHAPRAAEGFAIALKRAYKHISYSPGAGSPHYAEELEIPGLRFCLLRKFPYLIFYIECSDHVDVRRILHGHRDIPASMRSF